MIDPIVYKIAKTICFAGRAYQEHPSCPFCDASGQCQPEMWKTFLPEAMAVWALIQKEKPQGKQLILPGLGGKM